MINLAIEDAFVWSENVSRISFHFFSFLIDTFSIISFHAGSQFFFMLRNSEVLKNDELQRVRLPKGPFQRWNTGFGLAEVRGWIKLKTKNSVRINRPSSSTIWDADPQLENYSLTTSNWHQQYPMLMRNWSNRQIMQFIFEPTFYFIHIFSLIA